MTTPTTLEIARKFAEELVGNYDTARLILTLADQVEALIKERDSIAACYEAREEEAHQLSERIIKLTKERDTLAAAAKLALDALSVSYPTARSRLRAHNKAIEELQQAGVK